MWNLTLHRWTGNRHEAIENHLAAHHDWTRRQLQKGTLLLAGPSTDLAVGVLVFRELEPDALDALLRSEPFVANGCRSFEVIPWQVHQLFGLDATLAGW